jgi:hypothetical protein
MLVTGLALYAVRVRRRRREERRRRWDEEERREMEAASGDADPEADGRPEA